MWTWGYTLYGQLGDGTFIDRLTPVRMQITGATAATGGAEHSVLLSSDGTVWSTGSNTNSQIGDGISILHPTPGLVL